MIKLQKLTACVALGRTPVSLLLPTDSNSAHDRLGMAFSLLSKGIQRPEKQH
jgi:hypothetical protein